MKWLLLTIGLLWLLASPAQAANFVVHHSDRAFAQQVANAAAQYRRDLAMQWLGYELPDWRQPCPIQVIEGPQMGAGGQTSFSFDAHGPMGWNMVVQGTKERILDSVLPHEVLHTVFASHFKQPLPRWADEGACTTVEHVSERQKQQRMLIHFLAAKPSRGIAFNRMFAMREYPPDILPLYAQGHSLTEFLVWHGGERRFVAFVEDGLRTADWNGVTAKHYGYEGLSELQEAWMSWVRLGTPQPGEHLVAKGPLRNAIRWIAGRGQSAGGWEECPECINQPQYAQPQYTQPQYSQPNVISPPAVDIGPTNPAPRVDTVASDDSGWKAQWDDRIAAIEGQVGQLQTQFTAFEQHGQQTQEKLDQLAALISQGNQAAAAQVDQARAHADTMAEEAKQHADTRVADVVKRLGQLATKEEVTKSYKDAREADKTVLASAKAAAAKATSSISAYSFGKAVAVAFGYSTPVGMGVGVGLWLISRRLKKRIGRRREPQTDQNGAAGGAPSRPFRGRRLRRRR